MRVNIRTNLAMRVLMPCAVNRDRTLRKHDLARTINASEGHMAVAINDLGRLGLRRPWSR